MKRTFDDVNGSNDMSPKKGRTSTSPVAMSVFADATGKISRIPTISRKVRACSACKKQKIRCDFEEGETTCTRCKKMKLECVVNRSLQTILDEDIEWKIKMRDDTAQLQQAVEDILNAMNLRPLSSYATSSPTMSATSTEPPLSARQPTSAPPASSAGFTQVKSEEGLVARSLEMTRENSQEPPENDGSSLVSNPMGSLYEVTKLRSLRSSYGPRPGQPSDLDGDFISRGLITLSEGQELFELFRDSLNHYLFGIAFAHDTLNSVRSSSSLLSAAIFTVSSLHLPQHHHLFRICYREFLTLVSSSMFDRCHRLDDVRALCIGAFWLTDLSWKLSGHAVRIATELNIHQSFRKALEGSSEHYEKARLWYLLYVCDHHFSIAYGRPPVIHDHEPMRKYELYLQSSLATEGDNRVLSQVSLFVVLTRIYHFHEAEAEKEISDDVLPQLTGFNDQLDQWRTTWRTRLRRNDFVGDYPAKGVDLHYHFAKLQLNSLSLRGASPSTINNMSPLRRKYANLAIQSASSVLSFILEEPFIRDSLIGVPLYINTMIAFAAVFLLKVTTRWRSIGFSLESTQVWGQIEKVIQLLKDKRASEHHIIYHVALGLEKMLRKCIEFSNSKSPLDDSRLWDQLLRVETNGVVATASNNIMPGPRAPENVDERNAPGVSYVSPSASAGGPQVWHGYQHDGHGQDAQHMSGAMPSEHMMYGPNNMNSTGTTGPALYEVNGQYFPVHMGVFDFLSPQLPY
ncbi:hypothetical protein RUND412_002574 [Rhizina undulata]